MFKYSRSKRFIIILLKNEESSFIELSYHNNEIVDYSPKEKEEYKTYYVGKVNNNENEKKKQKQKIIRKNKH